MEAVFRIQDQTGTDILEGLLPYISQQVILLILGLKCRLFSDLKNDLDGTRLRSMVLPSSPKRGSDTRNQNSPAADQERPQWGNKRM